MKKTSCKYASYINTNYKNYEDDLSEESDLEEDSTYEDAFY